MENLDFNEQVASGAFGEVYRATERDTGAEVAVKRMKEVLEEGSEEYEMALREVVLLKRLSHVNIIRLQKAFKTPRGRLYLVFDYVPDTLQGLLKQQTKGCGLPMPNVKSLAFQLLTGLHYLHEQSIIHRDIKPSNLLINKDGVLKICDFGFARFLERESLSHQAEYSTYVVTRWYRPPEICVGDAYGSAVDVWAVGCILIELLTGQALFPGRNNNDQLFLIMQGLGRLAERHLKIILKDPSFLSFRMPTKQESYTLEQRFQKFRFDSDTWALLHACLDPNPAKRPTVQSLLQMKFFDGVDEALPAEVLTSLSRSKLSPLKSKSFSKVAESESSKHSLERSQLSAIEAAGSSSEPQVSFSRPSSSALLPGIDQGKKQEAIASAKAQVQAAANKALLEGDELMRKVKLDRQSVLPSAVHLPAPMPSFAKGLPTNQTSEPKMVSLDSKHRRNDSSSSVEGFENEKLTERTSTSSFISQKPPLHQNPSLNTSLDPESTSLNASLERKSNGSPSPSRPRGPMRYSGGIGSLVDVIGHGPQPRLSLNGQPQKQDPSVILKFKPRDSTSMDGGGDINFPMGGRSHRSSAGGQLPSGSSPQLPDLPRSISSREPGSHHQATLGSGNNVLPALIVKGMTTQPKIKPKPVSEPMMTRTLEQVNTPRKKK